MKTGSKNSSPLLTVNLLLQLSLVDLAGSERVAKTGSGAEQLRVRHFFETKPAGDGIYGSLCLISLETSLLSDFKSDTYL